MFNRIARYRFWISGGIIFVLGVWYLGTMLRFSGISIFGKSDKRSLTTLYKKAKGLYLSGAYKDSSVLYEKVLVLEPDNAAAVLDLAILYDDHLNAKDRAVEMYGRYLKLNPDSSKKTMVEEWIKGTARESLGIKEESADDKARRLEKELKDAEKEKEQLKKQIETLSGRLYAIQGEHDKELSNLYANIERLTAELTAARVRISKFANALSRSEKSRKALMDELAETSADSKPAQQRSGK